MSDSSFTVVSGCLSSAVLRPVTNWNKDGLLFSAGFTAGGITGGTEETGVENKSSCADGTVSSKSVASVETVGASYGVNTAGDEDFSVTVTLGVKASKEAGCLVSPDPNSSFGAGIAGKVLLTDGLEENDIG